MRRTNFLVGLSIGTLACGGAVAQTQGQTTPRQTERPTPARQAQTGQQGQFDTLRASKVIGKNVQNAQGEELGEIEDLAIDTDNSAVAYAVLSFGGFLGLGEDWFAIPWQSFQHKPDGTIVLDIDKSKLEQAEGFNKDRWPDMANERWATETHTQYGARPYWTGPRGERPGRIVKGSNLVGMDVQNAQKEDLGEVEDLLIDRNQGRVALAVLDLRALGMTDQLFGVPLEKLTISGEDQPLVLNVDRERLRSAPHFAQANWPEDDRAFVQRAYTFYEVEPYWGSVVPVEHRETPERQGERDKPDQP